MSHQEHQQLSGAAERLKFQSWARLRGLGARVRAQLASQPDDEEPELAPLEIRSAVRDVEVLAGRVWAMADRDEAEGGGCGLQGLFALHALALRRSSGVLKSTSAATASFSGGSGIARGSGSGGSGSGIARGSGNSRGAGSSSSIGSAGGGDARNDGCDASQGTDLALLRRSLVAELNAFEIEASGMPAPRAAALACALIRSDALACYSALLAGAAEGLVAAAERQRDNDGGGGGGSQGGGGSSSRGARSGQGAASSSTNNHNGIPAAVEAADSLLEEVMCLTGFLVWTKGFDAAWPRATSSSATSAASSAASSASSSAATSAAASSATSSSAAATVSAAATSSSSSGGCDVDGNVALRQQAYASSIGVLLEHQSRLLLLLSSTPVEAPGAVVEAGNRMLAVDNSIPGLLEGLPPVVPIILLPACPSLSYLVSLSIVGLIAALDCGGAYGTPPALTAVLAARHLCRVREEGDKRYRLARWGLYLWKTILGSEWERTLKHASGVQHGFAECRRQALVRELTALRQRKQVVQERGPQGCADHEAGEGSGSAERAQVEAVEAGTGGRGREEGVAAAAQLGAVQPRGPAVEAELVQLQADEAGLLERLRGAAMPPFDIVASVDVCLRLAAACVLAIEEEEARETEAAEGDRGRWGSRLRLEVPEVVSLLIPALECARYAALLCTGPAQKEGLGRCWRVLLSALNATSRSKKLAVYVNLFTRLRQLLLPCANTACKGLLRQPSADVAAALAAGVIPGFEVFMRTAMRPRKKTPWPPLEQDAVAERAGWVQMLAFGDPRELTSLITATSEGLATAVGAAIKEVAAGRDAAQQRATVKAHAVSRLKIAATRAAGLFGMFTLDATLLSVVTGAAGATEALGAGGPAAGGGGTASGASGHASGSAHSNSDSSGACGSGGASSSADDSCGGGTRGRQLGLMLSLVAAQLLPGVSQAVLILGEPPLVLGDPADTEPSQVGSLFIDLLCWVPQLAAAAAIQDVGAAEPTERGSGTSGTSSRNQAYAGSWRELLMEGLQLPALLACSLRNLPPKYQPLVRAVLPAVLRALLYLLPEEMGRLVATGTAGAGGAPVALICSHELRPLLDPLLYALVHTAAMGQWARETPPSGLRELVRAAALMVPPARLQAALAAACEQGVN